MGFPMRRIPHTPHSSMGADLGDLNNDGHLDLLVADMAATSRVKDQRGMAKLRAGLTEDTQRPDAAPQYMRNALFLNPGNTNRWLKLKLVGVKANRPAIGEWSHCARIPCCLCPPFPTQPFVH